MKKILVPLLLFCLLLSSCSSDKDEQPDAHNDLPIWTLAHAYDISESDDVIFGNVWNILVTSNHEVLVPDYSENTIYFFDQNGNFVEQFSRSGSGPGEIENMGGQVMTANDQILVYDWGNQRIIRFGQSNTGWSHITMYNLDSFLSSPFFATEDSDILIAPARTSFSRENINETDRMAILQKVTTSGEVLVDSLLTYPASDFLVYTDNDRFSVRGNPLGFRSNIDVMDGRYVIINESDSFKFRIFDIKEQTERQISHHINSVPLSDKNRRDALESVGEEFKSTMREKMPDYKRVVNTIIIDNEQRIWANISLPDDSDNPNWIILDAFDGELLGKLRTPDNFSIHEVRDGRLYGITRTDDTLPVIQVFSLVM